MMRASWVGGDRYHTSTVPATMKCMVCVIPSLAFHAMRESTGALLGFRLPCITAIAADMRLDQLPRV
jgi:hypothetical protein